MKNIVISDSRECELRDFMFSLNETCDKKFEIKVHLADLTVRGMFCELRRYMSYFFVPFRYFIKRKNFGIIVGWQQFYALIFCFYCAIFHVKKENKVIAWNFTYKRKKGKWGDLYHWFMRKGIESGYLDLIHVPSSQYADKFSQEFDFLRSKIVVAPFGIIDNFKEYSKLKCPSEMKGKKYFLAIGRSNRDYDFLIDGWKDIDSTLVIASDTYKTKTDLSNVVLKKDITAESQFAWIYNAEAIIISLDNPEICSGDTVMLTAMSLKKIVIVTNPSTLAEMYIQDKSNGILVNKDKVQLKNVIERTLNGEYQQIGIEARNCFLNNYTRGNMGVVLGENIQRI